MLKHKGYTDPKPGNLKLRLARLAAKPAEHQPNATDQLLGLMADGVFNDLSLEHVKVIGSVADLLDSYRFIVRASLKDNPRLRQRLETFAPASLLVVERDIDG